MKRSSRSIPIITSGMDDGIWYSILGRRGSMVVYISENPTGPNIEQERNSQILKPRHTYFSRLCTYGGKLLLNHHSMFGPLCHTERGDLPKAYLAPLKKVIFDEEGIMRIHYWQGNDCLKGDIIPLESTAPLEGVKFFTGSADFVQGIFIEGTVDLARKPELLLQNGNRSYAIKLPRRKISFGCWWLRRFLCDTNPRWRRRCFWATSQSACGWRWWCRLCFCNRSRRRQSHG